MKALIIILAVIIGLFALLLIAEVRVKTLYKDKSFVLKLSVFNITVFNSSRKRKSEKNEAEKKTAADKEDFDTLKFLIENKEALAADLKDILGFARKKIHVTRFVFDLTLGTGDAAETGILTGAVWSAVGLIYPALDSSLTFDKNPVINVNPVFNNPVLKLEYKGNYTLRIIHIIRIALKILFKFKKYKGGVKNGSTTSD